MGRRGVRPHGARTLGSTLLASMHPRAVGRPLSRRGLQLVFDTPYSMTLPFLDSIDADYVVHGDDISINADGTDAYA